MPLRAGNWAASICRMVLATIALGSPENLNVGFVVFVRKRLVEVQYLRATITQEQRDGFRRQAAASAAPQEPRRGGQMGGRDRVGHRLAGGSWRSMRAACNCSDRNGSVV